MFPDPGSGVQPEGRVIVNLCEFSQTIRETLLSLHKFFTVFWKRPSSSSCWVRQQVEHIDQICSLGFIDGTSGKLLNNTLVEKAKAEKFRSFVIASGRWLTNPVTRSCLAKVMKTYLFTAVDWSCKSANVKQIGHFSQPPRRSRFCEVY